MLTPSKMLAIKNWEAKSRWVLSIACVLVAGCSPPGPRALLQGKRLLEKGNYAEAGMLLRTATTLLATNALAWEYLGLACQHGGQWVEADRAYHRALALDHDLTEAHYNLGCLWLAQDKLDAAKAEFTAYTLRRSNAPEGFVKLGATQSRTAQLESSQAARARELSAAEKSFTEALRLSPQDPEGLNGLGLVRAQRGHAGEAVQCFNAALKQRPGYALALLNLAIVEQQDLRDLPVALQKYREYLALQPLPNNSDQVKAVVGQLEEQMQPPAPRTPATNDAASQTRSNTNLSVAPPLPSRLTVSDTQKAAASPTSQPARQPVAMAAATQPKTAPGRYPYQALSKPAPGNRGEAWRAYTEGLRAQSTNRLADAVQAYRSATRLDPSFFEATYNLAFAESQIGNQRASLSAYERALAIRPESAEARYNFALVLEEANYPVDAANELERLLTAKSGETRAELALGNIYSQKLQQPAKAREHYLKVLQAQPNHPEAEAIRQWLAANPP